MNGLKLFGLLLSLSLFGCETTHYVFKAPASEQGRLCVTQCAANKESCVNNQIQKERAENSACESRASALLQSCLSKAKDKKQIQDCENKQAYCGSYVDEEPCEQKYRQCFTTCGGAIDTIIER